MKNLKIRSKLIVSFAITIVLTAIIGFVGIISLNSSADKTALLNDRTNMAIWSARMGRNAQQQRAAYRGASTYYLMDMTTEVDAALAELDTLDADYDALAHDLEGMISTDEGARLLGEVSKAYEAFETERDKFVTAMLDEDTDNEEMMAVLAGLGMPVNNLVDSIATLTDYFNDLTDIQAEEAAATASSTTVVMIIVIAIAIAIAIALSLYISTLISRPIGKMQAIMKQAGELGNLHFSEETRNDVLKEAQVKDEIGQSMKVFAGFIDHLVYISDSLEKISEKDLTLDIELLGQEDTMGNAMQAMLNNLNDMFSEINSVAQQVSTAASEIATGAQTLAQGSTEQASTVQEISASINEITEQANVSVDTASTAAKESHDIRETAQDGNEKMNRLAAAVQEMSEASQSIGNVIKVIDDIAFQTNILALNAAVEAARAGEHGKGFAVVADEVRNLAGKSAEAAKETAALISSNIEKSEQGLTISHETAESLQQIVVGVEHTTEELNTIAQQSEGSKVATEQVNLAVDQVAQVIQQNSATSEQSAAASEEMSSQAQVLQQLIASFKLKDANKAPMIAGRSDTGRIEQYAASNSDVIF